MNLPSGEPRPPIDEHVLLETLSGAYGLCVDNISFLTTGWASCRYRVEAKTGESYLLKAYDESLPAPVMATSRAFYLPLAHQLCSLRLLPQIPCPVRARGGGFSVRAGPYLMILFHFIEGEVVGFGDLSHALLIKTTCLALT